MRGHYLPRGVQLALAICDTDYISLYKQLKSLGKIVVVVAIKGQSLGKITPEVDDYLFLDESFFSLHLRASTV